MRQQPLRLGIIVSGAFSEVRGQSFSSGFLAAGFSSAAAPLGPRGSRWGGAAFSAAVGGTGSVLGGGKFADGAVTATFTYLFNDAATNDGGLRCTEGNGSCKLLRSALKDKYSISREVNRKAIANDKAVLVVVGGSSSEFGTVAGSSLGVIYVGTDNGFVPTQQGANFQPRLFEMNEVFEHELSHALDWIEGIASDSGPIIITVSGNQIRYARGRAAGEARAVNRTNLYRQQPNGLSLRYSYEDPNFSHSVD